MYFGNETADQQSCTPQPKGQDPEPATPPEKPKAAKRQPRMVNQCTRAPAWTSLQDQRVPQLMKPRSKPHSANQDQDQNAEVKARPNKKKRARETAPKEDDGDDGWIWSEPEVSEGELPDASKAQHSSRRTRACKKKRKTRKELRLKGLRNYLAKIGVTYPGWLAFHYRACNSKKAGNCVSGTWTDMLNLLVSEKEDHNLLQCNVCKHVLGEHSFNDLDAERYMAEQMEEMTQQQKPDEEMVDEQKQNPDANGVLVSVNEKQDEQDDKDPEEELSLDAWVRSFSPHLQADG